jgi:hypothetical protein
MSTVPSIAGVRVDVPAFVGRGSYADEAGDDPVEFMREQLPCGSDSDVRRRDHSTKVSLLFYVS